jgi:uncharacterized membrane protein
MSKRIGIVIGCVGVLATFGLELHARNAFQPKKDRTEIATISSLPSLDGSGPSEALAVDEAGTVIVGSSWDRSDILHAVKWTLRNGSWSVASLPHGTASSAIARGVNNQGDAGGNNFPSSTSQPILWPATGGFVVLGCDTAAGPATVYGMSAGAQILVGQQGTAAVWQPGSCKADLPPLVDRGFAGARAVNSDGTIVGGTAAPDLSNSAAVPVRWTSTNGLWQIEQLDSRAGTVHGANTTGDLAGAVSITCSVDGGCQRAIIWYAGGGSLELGTLGGAHSWARDINASREVVGVSTSPRVGNTAFFWSESMGMFQLPVKGSWAAANAVSDVRPDGTRLVVGMNSQGVAVVWVVRNP